MISCCIFKRGGGSNLSGVLNDAKFCTFWFLSLWKLGRGGRDSYTNCWSFTYDRTFEIHLMAVLCVAAEKGGLIKKKKSLWVKLKAFPTNVGRPNKVFIFKAGASKLVCFLSLSHDSIKMCKFKSTAANIYTRTETGDKLASVLQIFRPLDVVQELRKAL